MPKAKIPSLDAEFAELYKVAAAADAEGRKFNFDGGQTDGEESSSPESVKHESLEPGADEKKESKPVEDKDGQKRPETNSVEDQEKSEATDVPKSKDEERFSKNWAEFQKEKESFRSERDSIKSEVEQLREKVRTLTEQPQKPPDTEKDPETGLTADDYEKNAERLEKDAEKLESEKEYRDAFKTAHWARQKAQKMRMDHMVSSFQREWQSNAQTIAKDNPDLTNPNSDFFKEVEKTVRENESFQRSPKGIITAVEFVKARKNTELVSGLRAEVETLKKEITRLNEISAPGGGGVNRTPSERNFNDMSTDEMYKYLMRQARESNKVS